MNRTPAPPRRRRAAPATAVSAAVLALFVALLPAGARAQARLIAASGELTQDGRPLAADTPIGAGVLATGTTGRAQVRLADGTLLVLMPASRVRLAAPGERRLALEEGGLRLAAAGGNAWQVDLPDRAIRATGMLRLQWCGQPCAVAGGGPGALATGLYGTTAAGEAVLEYSGGRSVLRNRHFRWATAALRPEVLVQQPAPLVEAADTGAASRVRGEAGATLKTAIEAFRDGDDARAEALLAQVQAAVPSETLVPYYRGLIALKREDNATALAQLQQYAREDPEGAAAREVAKTLTLLSSSQLRQEVATAVARERETASAPPEPNSIAVQAFVNRGDAQYRAMAKGLAAMVIGDLAKVPGLNVLEREKVQALMDEMKLGDSGLADRDSAVRSGRLMRAEKVIVGNFEVQ